MRTWFIGGMVALSLAVGAGQEEDEAKGPTWVTDYAKARQLARQSGKPLFLVFRCER